jgi:amino acid transporter, AAT family
MEREGGLQHLLTSRQLTMIAIGGAIGTGLFLGSSIAIGFAGLAWSLFGRNVLAICAFSARSATGGGHETGGKTNAPCHAASPMGF